MYTITHLDDNVNGLGAELCAAMSTFRYRFFSELPVDLFDDCGIIRWGIDVAPSPGKSNGKPHSLVGMKVGV
jgi:hypothetical protein